MAMGEDGQKSSWSSWFTPGDKRLAGESHHQKEDQDLKRPAVVEPESKVSHNQAHEGKLASGLSPLIAFKHLVDDGFAAIADLPNIMAAIRQHARQNQEMHRKLINDAHERWTGTRPPMEEMAQATWWVTWNAQWSDLMNSTKAREATNILMSECRRRNSDVNPLEIEALFREDPEWESLYVPGETGPPTGPFFFGRWLSIPWFKYSPYSPVNLEADPTLGKYDTKWRHAFEDLLEASLDKPMTSREKFGFRGSLSTSLSTWRGPGLDWMLSLYCRGILPLSHGGTTQYSMLLREISTPPLQDGERMCPADVARYASLSANNGHGAEMADTELDLYERLAREEDLSRAQQNPPGLDKRARGPVGRCPDDLGRAIGDAAREEAARAFADEENGLTDHRARDLDFEKNSTADPLDTFDFESFLAENDTLDAAARKEDSMSSLEARLNASLDRLERITEYFGDTSDHFSLIAEDLEEKCDMLQRKLAGVQQKTVANNDEQAEEGPLRPLGIASSLEREPEEAKRPSVAPETGSVAVKATGHALQDYQMQLMLLEQQNKKRLLMARGELDSLPPQSSRADAPSPTSKEKNGPQVLEQGTSQPGTPPVSVRAENERPQVLSTLTTTQTTRLHDGSVETKVVLKRRFADGREETQESTQTSFGDSTSLTAGDSSSLENKKGWFWS